MNIDDVPTPVDDVFGIAVRQPEMDHWILKDEGYGSVGEALANAHDHAGKQDVFMVVHLVTLPARVKT